MDEFKLNMYFQKFKDKPLPSRDRFREKFRKKYGKFQYTEELIKMIEKYQMKKYGSTLYEYIKLKSKEEIRKINKKANAREKRKINNVK